MRLNFHNTGAGPNYRPASRKNCRTAHGSARLHCAEAVESSCPAQWLYTCGGRTPRYVPNLYPKASERRVNHV